MPDPPHATSGSEQAGNRGRQRSPTGSANWVAAARLSAGGREPDRRGGTLAGRARRATDLTRDKSDPQDAVLIARLASELRCYEPERASAVWARLRHLGGAPQPADDRRDGGGEPDPGSVGQMTIHDNTVVDCR